MEQKVAFLDESGVAVIGDKASKLFVVPAVIVRATDLNEFRAWGDAIRVEHFFPGEIKSSGIKRRKE